MVSLVNSHTNAAMIGWHLWEIDLRFGSRLPPGWLSLLNNTSLAYQEQRVDDHGQNVNPQPETLHPPPSNTPDPTPYTLHPTPYT